MPWVAIALTIASDPVVHRIAATLKVRVPEAVGLLTLAFAGMVQHAPDGNVATVPDSLLEQWASWEGKRGVFATQFRAELTDETGLVTAWEKYNGANLRRLEAARERAREWREERDRARTERTENGNGTHTRTHTKRAAYTPTEQNRTGHNKKQEQEEGDTPTAAPAWLPSIRARWQLRVGRITPAVLTRELGAAIDLHGEPALLRAIDAYAEERLEQGKPMKLEWFAGEVAGWVERTKPVVDADGLPTERGIAIMAGGHA